MKLHKIFTALCSTVLLTSFIFAAHISAQQLDVDDSQLTENRSMQFEAWYDNQSWILATVNPLNFMEFSGGIGFDSDDRFSTERWAIESKITFFNPDQNKLGLALFGGLYSDFTSTMREFISYIPVTKILPDQKSMIHLNLGFEATFDELEGVSSGWSQRFFSGIRSDIYLSDQFSFLGEVVFMDFSEPLFQAGINWVVLPEKVEFLISYGEYFHTRTSPPGLNFGLTIMTDTLW